MKQTTLGSTGWALKTKVTRRAQFLTEMDSVVPWARLLAVIEPHYPKAVEGRPPHPMPRMLRIYFMQQWFNLSTGDGDALYDSEFRPGDGRRALRQRVDALVCGD